MSGYRKERGESRGIYTAIVHDLDFVPLAPPAKLLWYTLRLELGLSGIGVLYAASLPEPTGLSAFDVDAALQELSVTQWLVRERNVMWLRNALRFDPYVNMKGRVHVQSVVGHLAGLPRLKIVSDFCSYYGIEPAWLDSGVPAEFTPPPRERLYHWVSATPTDTSAPTPPLQEVGGRSKEVGVRREEVKASAASQPRSVVPRKDDPSDWMHAVWQDALGRGRDVDLTASRRAKYRALFDEQLRGTDDPAMAMRAIMLAVTKSEWHMGKREYQMPESLFKNADRRSTWVEKAVALPSEDPTAQRDRQILDLADYLKRNQA